LQIACLDEIRDAATHAHRLPGDIARDFLPISCTIKYRTARELLHN